MNTEKRNNSKMRRMSFIHLAVTFLLFLVTYYIFYRSFYSSREHLKADALLCAVYLFFLAILSRTYNAYDVGYSSVIDLIYSQTLVAVLGTFAAYVMVALVYMALKTPVPFLVMLLCQFIWNIAWSLGANRLYFKINPSKRTAIIYKNKDDLIRLSELNNLGQNFKIVKLIEDPADLDSIVREIQDVDCICVAGIDEALRNRLVKFCAERDIPGFFAPHIGDVLLQGAKQMLNFSIPVLNVQRAAPNEEYLFIKRAFDIFVAGIATVIMSPFMLVTAAAIKLYDGGPAIYKQVRLTKDGREFEIYKFRSMRVDAEKDGVARLSTENDERITPIGRLIRAARFDELPQLFNILKGDMSIVGPRPERPEIARQYEQLIPTFPLRLQVKAGLTGFAQVYGKYNTDPYDKLQYDLMYIYRMSIAEDLKLMLATVKILFMKESTEGVAEGSVTAVFEQSSTAKSKSTEQGPSEG